MLFGEYAVIAGGEGLAIPYPKFTATWIEENKTPSEFKPYLIKFCDWLFEKEFESILNLNLFNYDLQHGLDIASNVPIGYGVGSSGVVVAAVFDKYAIAVPASLIELKKIMASMENYFHATSSGLDPLVCYLNKTVHVHPEGISIVEKNLPLQKVTLQLADCGASRSTQQLVATFNQKMNDATFKMIVQDYIKISNSCITAWLNGNELELLTHLRELSALQFTHFDFAIPEHMRERWQSGLNTGNEIMKLCGAGGGGFLIAFNPIN